MVVAARRSADAWEPLHLRAARAAVRPIMGREGLDAGSWQQRWIATGPGELEVHVDGRQALDHRVYRAHVIRQGVSTLMAAKVMALQPGDAEALIPHLHDVLYTARRSQPLIPSLLLRDAVFGQVVGGAARAEVALVSTLGLMTLHPLAEGSLHQLLVPLDKIPIQQCEPVYLRIAYQLADELHRCVQRRVVHNDIKPENVLFWRDGTLRLNDFGSSFGTWEADRTAAVNMPVSLAYSPVFERYDAAYAVTEQMWPHARDIFGLGATLWTLIAGESPMQCAWEDSAIAASRQRWIMGYETVRALSEPGAHAARKAPQLAAPLAETLRRLATRAPSAARLIVDMLNPSARSRPTIEQVVARLAVLTRNDHEAHAPGAWLKRLGVLRGTRQPGPSLWPLAARAPSRMRSHSAPEAGCWTSPYAVPHAPHERAHLFSGALRLSAGIAAWDGAPASPSSSEPASLHPMLSSIETLSTLRSDRSGHSGWLSDPFEAGSATERGDASPVLLAEPHDAPAPQQP